MNDYKDFFENMTDDEFEQFLKEYEEAYKKDRREINVSEKL